MTMRYKTRDRLALLGLGLGFLLLAFLMHVGATPEPSGEEHCRATALVLASDYVWDDTAGCFLATNEGALAPLDSFVSVLP